VATLLQHSKHPAGIVGNPEQDAVISTAQARFDEPKGRREFIVGFVKKRKVITGDNRLVVDSKRHGLPLLAMCVHDLSVNLRQLISQL
jgi:hypothetical protein